MLIIALIAIPIVAVNLLTEDREKFYISELIDEGIAQESIENMGRAYRAIIKHEPHNLDLHVELITKMYNHNLVALDAQASALRYYENLTQQDSGILADNAHICQGLIYAFKNEPNVALGHFVSVKETNRKYLNYGTALVMHNLMDFQKADSLYQREIKVNGFVEGAYRQLAYMYKSLEWDTLYHNKLVALLKTDDGFLYANSYLRRQHYYEQLDVARYMKSILHYEWNRISPKGALAAFLVMLAWLFYVRNLDVYEPERWVNLIITFVLGFSFTYLVFPLTDLLRNELSFAMTGSPGNDFLYCWFGIGAVEELVKIIPFLIMLKFSNAVNESYDYILYASVAALGFAFNENLLYYHEGQLNIISARALYTSVGHMFWSSTIAYGLLVNKLRWKKNPLLIFIGFYLLSALGHGFYDFWIINDWAMRFAVLTPVFFLLSLHIWVVFINNALNNSHFFDHRKRMETDRIQLYLIVALLTIVMVEYTILGYKYGSVTANHKLMNSSLGTGLFILYIASSLSNFEIVKGHWSPIRFPKNLLLPRIGGNNNYSSLKIKITNTAGNFYLKPHLPVTGSITERLVVSGSKDWYLVKLDHPINMRNYVQDQIIIQSRYPHNNMEEDKNVIVYTMMIPHSDILTQKEIGTEDLRFVGYSVVNRYHHE